MKKMKIAYNSVMVWGSLATERFEAPLRLLAITIPVYFDHTKRYNSVGSVCLVGVACVMQPFLLTHQGSA